MSKPASILVVDDEPNLRRTMAFILQRAGYHVVTAAGGLDALSLFKQEEFNLLFIDLQLLDVEGLRLADEIHKIRADVPVIILTGHPPYEILEKEKRQAILAYLSKPIDPAQILAKVAEILKNEKQS